MMRLHQLYQKDCLQLCFDLSDGELVAYACEMHEIIPSK